MWSCRLTFAVFVFVKQKTAYEMCISDWSSDVCSSDLRPIWLSRSLHRASGTEPRSRLTTGPQPRRAGLRNMSISSGNFPWQTAGSRAEMPHADGDSQALGGSSGGARVVEVRGTILAGGNRVRSAEHTSELQALM